MSTTNMHNGNNNIPNRDDKVAAWIKHKRDEHILDFRSYTYSILDRLLDDYRLHADTGVDLDHDVIEGDDGN